MELKFPKKVEIGDYLFTVKYNKTHAGGSLNYGTRIIEIGILHIDKDPVSVFGVINHEIMECVTILTNTRFTDNGAGGDYKFFMTHKEFEVNTAIFTRAILNFIK